MPKYFLLFGLFMLMLKSSAQPSAEDIKKYHISKVTKKRTIGEGVFTEIHWYDRKGNDSAKLEYDRKTVIKRNLKNGKLISEIHVAEDGKEENRFEYAYNADGGYKITHTDGQFGMKSYEWYNGKKKLTKSQSPDGNTITFKYDAKGNLVNVTSDGYNYGIKIKRNYQYNSKNQLIKADEVMDGVKSKSVYTYNSKGQLIRLDDEEEGMKTTRTYTYDEKGKLVKMLLTGDSVEGPSTTTSVYEYNEKGLLIKLTSKRIFEEPKEKEQSDEITTYEYEYF